MTSDETSSVPDIYTHPPEVDPSSGRFTVYGWLAAAFGQATPSLKARLKKAAELNARRHAQEEAAREIRRQQSERPATKNYEGPSLDAPNAGLGATEQPHGAGAKIAHSAAHGLTPLDVAAKETARPACLECDGNPPCLICCPHENCDHGPLEVPPEVTPRCSGCGIRISQVAAEQDGTCGGMGC